MQSESRGDTEVMAVDSEVERRMDSRDDCEGVPDHYPKKHDRDKDFRDKYMDCENQEESKSTRASRSRHDLKGKDKAILP